MAIRYHGTGHEDTAICCIFGEKILEIVSFNTVLATFHLSDGHLPYDCYKRKLCLISARQTD